MLYDFITTDKKLKKPLYQQIYLSIREAIENGSLKKGSKLPTVVSQKPPLQALTTSFVLRDISSADRRASIMLPRSFRALPKQPTEKTMVKGRSAMRNTISAARA